MFEVKVTIESPALVEAMNNLASAIVSGMTVKVPEVKAVAQPVQNQQTAPVAPVQQPTQTPVQTPVQTQPFMNAPTAAPTPTAPTQAPVQQTPAPVAPTQPAQQATTAKAPITLEAISRAGAALVDQGKMQQIMGLLSKYGVQAITQLQPNTYEAFAAEMRTLGAQI